jgi:HlyD family secretion protein
MKRRRSIKEKATIAIISLVLMVSASCRRGNGSYTFETAIVKKGSIINKISATGTIQADTTVLIGTQVSGVIKKIFVDFNSIVRKGQLLAVLDTTPLQTQVRQAEASLDDSKGEVEFQLATYERYKALLDKKLIAQADYDQVKYNYEKARANLKTAQAGYDKAIVNLNYATISSPIKGVILNRAVDQGQTVAASFSTPNLFTIANDLTQMHVEANVEEADIGQLKQGQPTTFTVDAYPNEVFNGDVRQIRLQPVVTSNVVTYTVIINAPNPEKKLMPGMTATIWVLVQKLDSVLIVPGKALRFTPDNTFLAEYLKKHPVTKNPAGNGADTTRRYERQRAAGEASQANASSAPTGIQQNRKPVVVWVKSGDLIRRARVATGAIDGTNSEIKWGLKEGDEVILSMSLPGKTGTAAATAQTTSPFMPQRAPQGAGRR